MTSTRTRPRAGSPPRSNGRKIATREEWEASALHEVELHSGNIVLCRIPDLPTLMLADAVPEHLRDAAVQVLNQEMKGQAQMAQALAGVPIDVQEFDYEQITRFAELKTWLAAEMVVEPEVTADDFRAGGMMPKEDAALLTAIAARERSTDARGRRLGVVELRELDRFLLEYECSPGCEGCAANRAAVSGRSDRKV